MKCDCLPDTYVYELDHTRHSQTKSCQRLDTNLVKLDGKVTFTHFALLQHVPTNEKPLAASTLKSFELTAGSVTLTTIAT